MSEPTRYVRTAARLEIHVVAALPPSLDAPGSEFEQHVGELWDRVWEALDAIPGVFCQGGASERMDFEDVIAGSPLADALIEARGGEARDDT